MNNISDVVTRNLCTGCGTCISFCPQKALNMILDRMRGIYVPSIDVNLCNNCGFCYDICPGHSVDFNNINTNIFKETEEDQLIGNYLECFTGRSNEVAINRMSSSGGLVTQFLIYSLENGLIDGAIVTRMNKNSPLEPEPFIARTKEEIISACQSKYCPVPLNVMLKELMKTPEDEKFAVVGLPCHIHGIRKAEQLNLKLKNKIVLHLGIFCGHTPSLIGTEFILEKIMHVDTSYVKQLSYRGNGWPGGITVELEDGVTKSVPYHYVWGNIFSQFFYPFRCTLCCDQTGEMSDISFGDAWLPEFMKLKNSYGYSIVIVRTEFGNGILQRMKNAQIIDLNKTTVDNVIKSQYGMSLRRNVMTRLRFCSFFKKSIPHYNKTLCAYNKYYLAKCIWFYSDLYLSSKKYIWVFLPYYISVRSSAGKIINCLKGKK